jgi:hypothetical protein
MSELELLLQKREQVSEVLELIEFIFKDEAGWLSPDDTSYLNDADRANPDITANVEAMSAINQQVDWFGSDDVGFVGVWRATGHIVRLDTEGQYRIVACDVGDYLARAVREPDFDEAREILLASGFKVSVDRDAIYKSLNGAPDVNAARNALYKEARARRS